MQAKSAFRVSQLDKYISPNRQICGRGNLPGLRQAPLPDNDFIDTMTVPGELVDPQTLLRIQNLYNL